MESKFVNLFAVNRFSSGRRVSIYNQLEEAARARRLIAVLPYIERAREHDLATRALDDRWAAPERRTLYPRTLRRIDNLSDGVLGQFRDIARAQIADLDPEDPFRHQVERMLATLFPAGLSAITSLPYIDQVAAVENILVELNGGFAPLMADLGLQRKVARLAELTAEYREAVDRPASPLDYASVREARDRGHAYLLEIICMIIGIYHDSDNPEHREARAELLGPIIAHSRTVQVLRRRDRAGNGGSDEVPEPGEVSEPGDPGEVAELTAEPDAVGDESGSGEASDLESLESAVGAS